MTKVPGVARAFAQAAAQNPGGRYSDYFTTHDEMYVSPDGHTAFAEIFPAGNPGFDVIKSLEADAGDAETTRSGRHARRT